MFCPFTKNNQCEYECVFNNKCYEENDPCGCNLNLALSVINSMNLGLTVFQKNLNTSIKNIESNTGSDQTDSFNISQKLDDILKILNTYRDN